MLRYASGQRRSVDEFPVAGMFDEVADTYRDLVGEGALVIEPADPAVRVAGDRDALKGAICNLIDNARQAPGTSTVRLSMVGRRGETCLSVADDGAGIDESVRPHLFEPFYTTRPQGTGLGLAVVRTVAEAHGGRVTVESAGAGTTFTISLPQWEAQ